MLRHMTCMVKAKGLRSWLFLIAALWHHVARMYQKSKEEQVERRGKEKERSEEKQKETNNLMHLSFFTRFNDV